ncbi:YdcH family protein [Sphingomonas lenta]|nr:YdcH family protein [Sphingomonas lenta]
MTNYVDRLRKAHQALSDAIRREAARPGADMLALAVLKKRRLLIKDRLSALLREATGLRTVRRARARRMQRA